MSKKQVITTSEDYLLTGGIYCPVCDSEDIECGDSDQDGRQYWNNVVCNKCNARWIDVYSLIGYDNLEIGKEVIDGEVQPN